MITIGLAYLMVGLLAFSLWALTLASRQVKAHEAPSGWHYPAECCSNQDCAPVTKWTHDPATGLIEIQTRFGTGTISVEALHRTARPSGDGGTHACILNARVICVFLPNSI